MNFPIETTPKNLENIVLKGLLNRTVIADVLSNVQYASKILPYIKLINVEGDVVKMVGLISNKPVQFTWDYDTKKFGPGETVTYKSELTEQDRWIFRSVFSEPIEKLAIDQHKLAATIDAQAEQVGYDIADFYDNEFVQEYVCDSSRYKDTAIRKLTAQQLNNVQSIGEVLITIGYQMTSPSTLFNKREQRVNVRDTKQLLLFINSPLYARMEVASTYTTTSPVLDVLRRIFTVIPINMCNSFQASLIDSKGIALAQMLHQRYLKLDEYVASYKVLDHVWRKWIFADFRPSFSLIFDEKTFKNAEEDDLHSSSKTLLTNYAELSDGGGNVMKIKEAREWNTAGFDYSKTEAWLNNGLLNSDSSFVKWLSETKSLENVNFANPEWLLANAGKNDIKSIAELRKEAKGG